MPFLCMYASLPRSVVNTLRASTFKAIRATTSQTRNKNHNPVQLSPDYYKMTFSRKESGEEPQTPVFYGPGGGQLTGLPPRSVSTLRMLHRPPRLSFFITSRLWGVTHYLVPHTNRKPYPTRYNRCCIAVSLPPCQFSVSAPSEVLDTTADDAGINCQDAGYDAEPHLCSFDRALSFASVTNRIWHQIYREGVEPLGLSADNKLIKVRKPVQMSALLVGDKRPHHPTMGWTLLSTSTKCSRLVSFTREGGRSIAALKNALLSALAYHTLFELVSSVYTLRCIYIYVCLKLRQNLKCWNASMKYITPHLRHTSSAPKGPRRCRCNIWGRWTGLSPGRRCILQSHDRRRER